MEYQEIEMKDSSNDNDPQSKSAETDRCTDGDQYVHSSSLGSSSIIIDSSAVSNQDDCSPPIVNDPTLSVAVLDVTEQQTQPQPQTSPSSSSSIVSSRPIVLTPPSINIMDEHGQHTGSIDIDTDDPRFDDHPIRRVIKLTDTERNAAILVKKVHFSYSKKNEVLSDISLDVPKGQIFALLGASGCGKTTLLHIILGRIRPQKGLVRVFGSKPGSVHSNVPGSGVGYMPQELALFGHFTLDETFYYYGMLHHLPKVEIRQKTDFLIELLNLPSKDRLIAQCSGGQQRRASIAIALFHNPPLLILDEPTVGVDPLLRCKIWQYLEYLCKNNGMTTIITTHYIEESRNAYNLAFMRFGRILSQDKPDNLLEKFQCTILEDVFLKLCQQDCGQIKKKYSTKRDRKENRELIADQDEKGDIKNKSFFNSLEIDSARLNALIFKNMINLKRNPFIVFFFLILPVIQIVLFCYSVFKKPDNLPVSIYNGEGKGMSQQFLESLDTHMLKIKYYKTHEEALQTVIDGKAWYAISIGRNFSKAYRRRAKNPSDLSEDMFEFSKIKLYVDHSDSFMLLTIRNSILNSYQKFVETITESFGFHKETVRLPIYTKEIVYGFFNPGEGYDIMANLCGGSLVAIIYTIPLIMSAFLVVLERKGGIIERTFVSGATSAEVFATHLATMMVALLIQAALLMAVAVIIFELDILGSHTEMFILIYLQGLVGIFTGLIISSISPNEVVALLLSLGMVFPVWMMCGVFWPLESLTPWLQKIFWCMPLSHPIRSIELIVKKGWTYEHFGVQCGYIASVLYNCILLLVNVVIFHITSK